MRVILYTTGCPRCKVLRMMLDKKHIAYDIHDDIDEMKQLGLKSAPALQIDNRILSYEESMKWITSKQE